MARKKAEEPQVFDHTKGSALSDPNSCLARAAEDEPIFVLRANDELAPDTVRSWAERYHAAKGRNMSIVPEQLQKYNDAYQAARDMETWKRGLDLPLPEVNEDGDNSEVS